MNPLIFIIKLFMEESDELVNKVIERIMDESEEFIDLILELVHKLMELQF